MWKANLLMLACVFGLVAGLKVIMDRTDKTDDLIRLAMEHNARACSACYYARREQN